MLINQYLEGLNESFNNSEDSKDWEVLLLVKEGISEDNLNLLKKEFPLIPESLVELLKFADGTYGRKYGNTNIRLCILGSSIEEYPYYLLSADQILQDKNIAQCYSYITEDTDFEDEVDPRISKNVKDSKWLHFSDDMNNGGSSQLYIDFTPSESGKVGQIVMYVHDPDSLYVIADSFDEYLEMLIKAKFDFIH